MSYKDYSKIKLKNGKVTGMKKDFADTKSVIDKVFKNLSLDEKIKDFEIMQFWQTFIEGNASKTIAKNTKAHRINKDRYLIVGVYSAVLANELQFKKAKLEAKFLKEIKGFEREVKGVLFELRT